MATSIPAVSGKTNIKHCIAIDLTLGANVYHLSGAYKSFSYEGNDYTELGSFLSISSIAEDIKATNGDISITLSGIPSQADYMSQVLNTPIKGGEVTVYRAFFDDNYVPIEVYQRFKGIITNFSITEDVDILGGKNTNIISVTCASINTVLENKTTGQRTNLTDRQKHYPTDQTFKRVKDLHNVNFDFGRKYTGGTGYGGGGGGGFPGIPGDINFNFR